MKNIKLKIVFIFSLILFLQSGRQTLAQEFSTAINPPILQIEAQAPASVKAPLSLENQSDLNTTYSIFLRPFKPSSTLNGDPNYDPKLNNEYKDFFTHVQLQDGVKAVTDISLAPGEKKNLTLKINLPEGFKASDYYFTVVFLAQSDKIKTGTSTAGAKGGIGANVLLSVGSRSEPKGRIAEFNAPKIILHGPVGFKLELANHNDYFVSSKGNLIVKNIFNQPVGNLEFGPINILANSNRLIGNNNDPENPLLLWDDKYPIGIYKAQVNVAISDKGPLLTQNLTFIAFPIQFFLFILFLGIGISWLIKRARKKSLEIE